MNILTTPAGLNFTICSFGDDLSIGVSTIYRDLNVIRNLCRILTAAGIDGLINIGGVHVEGTAARKEEPPSGAQADAQTAGKGGTIGGTGTADQSEESDKDEESSKTDETGETKEGGTHDAM